LLTKLQIQSEKSEDRLLRAIEAGTSNCFPVWQKRQKNRLKECIFGNSALKILVKNILLQTAFFGDFAQLLRTFTEETTGNNWRNWRGRESSILSSLRRLEIKRRSKYNTEVLEKMNDH